MTIAIDVRHSGLGGIPYYVRRLVEGLVAVDDGHRYLLVHNSWRRPHPYLALATPDGRVQCVNLGIPNKVLNGAVALARWPYFDQLVRWRTGRAVDVVLAPNLHFLAVSSRARLVTVVHDIAFALLPDHLGWRQRHWHTMINAKKLLLRSDQVVAVSRQTACDVVRHFGVKAERVAVSGEGFERVDHGDPQSHERYILMMGVRDERKNWQAAVEAFALMVREHPECDDLTLVMVGSAAIRQQVALLLRRLDLSSDKITWHESVTPAECQALYRGATALLYPSIYEGFGLPPLEALSSNSKSTRGL